MEGEENIDKIGVEMMNNEVEMRIDEIEEGCSEKMEEKKRIDVIRMERLEKKGIFNKINMEEGKIIRREKVKVDE